jgi:hypothetical protein
MKIPEVEIKEATTTRREAVFGTGTALALASLGASCTPQQVADVEKMVASFINDVQANVKKACALVPTASSVIAILQVVAGSTSAASVTGAMIKQVIDEIAAVGCPPPGISSSSATIRGVPVEWYP